MCLCGFPAHLVQGEDEQQEPETISGWARAKDVPAKKEPIAVTNALVQKPEPGRE